MEFTYEGIVRYGFGFYNPNHAAALINLLIPFSWLIIIRFRNPVIKGLASISGIMLLLALALTFSRTGFVVFFIEVWLFLFPLLIASTFTREQKVHATVTCLSAAVVFLMTAFACGTFARASAGIIYPDAAVTNRFLIWKGGLQLFADNPLGVGLGYSGLLYTCFLAPEDSGIHCRTLVNSWLTFLAETGIIYSFMFCLLLFSAFFCGVRKWVKMPCLNTLTCLIAFLSVILSGMMSTCLNVNDLCDFQDFGQWTVVNFALSWLYCCLFLVMIIPLIRGARIFSRETTFAFTVTVALFIVLWISGKANASHESVKVVNNRGDAFAYYYQSRNDTPLILTLPDDNWNLEESIHFLKQSYPESVICIPLESWQFKTALPMLPHEKLILFGYCGFLARQTEEKTVDLVSPPETLPLTNNIHRIYLRRFTEDASEIIENAKERKISIMFY